MLIAGYGINAESHEGETPLTVAIAKKNRRLFHMLLNSGANVNRITAGTGKRSNTALSTAIGLRDIDMVNELFLRGADPGDSAALLKSCQIGGEMFHLLVETFLKRYPHGKRGYCDDVVDYAIRNDDPSMLDLIQGLMTLKIPGYGDLGMLLMRTVKFDNKVSTRVLSMLLDSGANPNEIVSDGILARMPILNFAIEAKNVRIIELLLEKGADVNFPATRGVRFTPIQAAVQTGPYDIVENLIDRGADVDVPAADFRGGTAIQLAAIGGFVGIVELLLKKGAQVNRAPSILDGRTALEGAAEHGRLDMVHFLLQSGAYIDERGGRSFVNAMDFAEKNGHFAVLELLQSY